ncbi:MAG TPA: sensor domain-containing diguanylate cyclase [Candidatus Limnocylindrales bacterium]|nr:sensor domain-containing diguanylate cyclase [Candidatus Limnocylindrales bacterium]
MSSSTQRPPRPVDPSDRRIRRSWWIFSVAYGLVGLIAIAGALDVAATLTDRLLVVAAIVAGGAALVHGSAVGELGARRRAETESFARILSGLSRSVSPDAIVDAIVEELGGATGVDHTVVVRRAEDGRSLAAHLVSARPGVPEHSTPLPLGDLTDPVRGRPASPAETADRIARRVRDVYGLGQVLAAPLTTPEGVVGAIVVARRTGALWPDATRRLLAGSAVEASAALARVSSHRAAEARAATDALTGLPNRHYFDEYVSLLARRRRAGDAVGILMVDIDRFKVLNDTFGHATGDEVLRAVASAIVSAVREDDVPARFGGEEFVVLLRNPGPGVAIEIGERIRAAVRGLDLRRFGVRQVSVSIGVAVADGPDGSVGSLIEVADRALYRAKRAGRDRVVAA